MFLIAYLVVDLAFATIDWRVAGDRFEQHYYAPYAKLEPSSLRDTRQVELNLRGAVLRTLEENQTDATAWQVDRDSLNISHLDAPRDGLVTFTLFLEAQHYTHGEISEGIGGPFEITMDTKRMALGSPIQTVCHFVTAPQITKSGAPYAFDFGILFNVRQPRDLPSSVCWSAREDEDLGRLLIGWKGNPRMLSGFFGRMIYFSTTTITTVGFGDIVPLSETARALAGLEAIAGWLVAGLFLNAIAWRAGQAAVARNEPNEPPAP
jgi:hypothetical protein